MANPIFINVTPHNTWVKVATNVTTGQVSSRTTVGIYSHMYKVTGAAAPTLSTDGINFDAVTIDINSPSGIDVYIQCTAIGASVRVDL